MAASVKRGATADECAVRLVPDHNDYDSNSIGEEDSEKGNGHAKMDQHRYVAKENTPWATRCQLFYLFVIVAIIAFIAFINLIVSSVGVHKMQLSIIQVPPEESAGLIQEIQENDLDFVERGSHSINSSEDEQDFFIEGSCMFTWIEHVDGPPPMSKVSVGDSSFLVVRARRNGGLIPGEAGSFLQIARYAYDGNDHRTTEYQILTAPSKCVRWVKPSQPGKIPHMAVPGGIEPVTSITLYICATSHEQMLFFGWVKENGIYCNFAFGGATKTEDYTVLTSS